MIQNAVYTVASLTLLMKLPDAPCMPCAGEQLRSGWLPVLKLLEAVPGGQGAATTGLGFQSVQLLASDYMSSLPPALLQTCLSVATLYASQQVRPPLISSNVACRDGMAAYSYEHVPHMAPHC